jgi:hypothetical protein
MAFPKLICYFALYPQKDAGVEHKKLYVPDKKSRSHLCVFANNSLYLQCRILYAARHNQEAFLAIPQW